MSPSFKTVFLALAGASIASASLTQCHRDNCLRALAKDERAAEASAFCATFTEPAVPQVTELPSFLGNCHGNEFRISSACSCVFPAATATATAVQTTSTAAPTETAAPEPPAECQVELENADFGFSFSPVPIWKEPWVVGACLGSGNCTFVGGGDSFNTGIEFDAGGYVSADSVLGQVGQSINLCPREEDYKLVFRSASVTGDSATTATFIMFLGGTRIQIEPAQIGHGEFYDSVLEMPGSAVGGEGFIFFNGNAAPGDALLVDNMNFI